MDPIERTVTINDLKITYYEYSSKAKPTLLMVHGAGLHGRIWGSVIRKILHSTRVVTPDLRGHGKSDRLPPYDWDTYGNDLVDFIKACSLRNLVGVGHSFGGYVVVHAAMTCPDAFDSLVLIDPAIMDPNVTTLRNFLTGFRDFAEHPIEKRKWQWESLTEMTEYFQTRVPYSDWKPDVLEDYCRFGIRENLDGGVSLACPPVVESLIYLSPIEHIPEENLAALTIPTTVVRAKQLERERPFLDFVHSFTRHDIADHIPNITDIYIPDANHFIPMQYPELIASTIEDHLRSNLDT